MRILICLSSASRRREALVSKSLCLDRVAQNCQGLLNFWLCKSYHMLASVGFLSEETGESGENSGVRLRSTESQHTYNIYSRAGRSV